MATSSRVTRFRPADNFSVFFSPSWRAAPTPEEIAHFLQEAESGFDSALSKWIDRLLGSPRFGERWGRHWLDVARFAESSGYERNFTYPHAWRYRDYVIAAFNRDKPYDQFVREQIAGDLLPFESRAQQQSGQGDPSEQGEGPSGEPGEGQPGQSGAQGEGAQGQEQPSIGQQGQAGQQGEGQQGQGGQQQGQGGLNQDRGGMANGFGPGAQGDRGQLSEEEIRQLQRAYREQRRDAEALRDQLREAGADVSDLDGIVQSLRAFDNQRAYEDLAEIEALQAALLEEVKRFEFGLRRAVEGEGESLLLRGSGDVPPGYEELIREYYKALAEGRRGGGN